MAIAGFQFAVIILGAGRSSRMGQPKLLLPWGGRTVIEHLIEQWNMAGASQVGVVVAGDSAIIADVVRNNGRAQCIPNPDPNRGMFSSVRCAAQWRQWQPLLTHWIISLGDQPHLRDATLSGLVEAVELDPQSIWQPSYKGRRRHPVVLPKNTFTALAETTAPDLKAFLESSPLRRNSAEIDDPGLEIDIDTPEDYARAKTIARQE